MYRYLKCIVEKCIVKHFLVTNAHVNTIKFIIVIQFIIVTDSIHYRDVTSHQSHDLSLSLSLSFSLSLSMPADSEGEKCIVTSDAMES